MGVSVDGFLARRNHELDFLPPDGGAEHGYADLLAGIDVIVIGRNTFEVVQKSSPPWPYGNKRVVVLSSRAIALGSEPGVEQMSGEPAAIVEKLAATGAHNLYVDGGITIQRFLRAGFVDRITVTRVPVLIGDGIPLFGTLPHDIGLRHISTSGYPGGLVKSEYEVVR